MPTRPVEVKTVADQKPSWRHGLRYVPDEVIVSNGGKHVIRNALAATLDPDDEVVVPAPFPGEPPGHDAACPVCSVVRARPIDQA